MAKDKPFSYSIGEEYCRHQLAINERSGFTNFPIFRIKIYEEDVSFSIEGQFR